MDAPYAPWRDDALLPEESAFSLISKVAWFHAMPAVEYLFEHQSATGQWKKAPKVVRLHAANWWVPFLVKPERQPLIDGKLLAEELAQRAETEPAWLSYGLRHCPTCLRHGLHLRIHQHRAVVQCPVHRQPLTTRCLHCSAELFHVVHRGIPAFTCPSCGQGWLHRELDAFRYDEAFRARVARANTHVLDVLPQVLPPGRVHCGISNPELTEQELETPWTGQMLWFGAKGTQSNLHPRWLRTFALADGITVECLPVSLRSGVPRHEVSPVPEHGAHLDPSGPVVRLGVERLRAAACRVAAITRTQCAPSHTECLDLPYRMFGLPMAVPHDDYEDLMNCCPVALGFWLWQQAVVAMLDRNKLDGYFHAPAGTCDLDRMCYLNAKSHLHYCIAAAAECLRLGKQDRASSWAEILLLLAKSEWYPLARDVRIGQAPVWWFDLGDQAWLLRFRATALIAELSCPGVQTYKAYWARIVALMRRSRRQTILGPDDATTPECWFRRLEPPAKIVASDLHRLTLRFFGPAFNRNEPPRLSRRLPLLRGWSHEQTVQVFPGSA